MGAVLKQKPTFNPNLTTDQLLRDIATRVQALEDGGIKAVAMDELRGEMGQQLSTAIASAVVNLDKLAVKELAEAREEVSAVAASVANFPKQWQEMADIIKSHGHDLDVMENSQSDASKTLGNVRANVDALQIEVRSALEAVQALVARVESAAQISSDARAAVQGIQTGTAKVLEELTAKLDSLEKRWAAYVSGQQVPVKGDA